MPDAPRIHRTENFMFRKFSLISWRALFAGLFASMFFYALLCSLGVAIGGLAARDIVQNGITGLTIGAAIWMVVSAMIALFFGSYIASRLSHFATMRVGMAHGCVIASLFFVALLIETGMTLGLAGVGIGASLSKAVGASVDLANSGPVQNAVEASVDGLNLPPNADVDTIIRGLTPRLIRGDTDGARNYLARVTGLSRPEVDARITQITASFQNAANVVADKTGKAISIFGWILFASMVLGGVCASLGGGWGSTRNARSPLSRQEIESMSVAKAANW